MYINAERWQTFNRETPMGLSRLAKYIEDHGELYAGATADAADVRTAVALLPFVQLAQDGEYASDDDRAKTSELVSRDADHGDDWTTAHTDDTGSVDLPGQ